jgi:two-component system sensor histidine kinase CpxA
MAVESKRAADIFERGGKPGLERYLATGLRKGGYGFLLDENGNEMLDQNAPSKAIELARTLNEAVPFTADFSHGDRFAAEQVTGPSGRKYIFVVMIPRVPIRSLLAGLGAPAIFSLISVLLVGGVLCFWLARHITNPLVRLGDAAGRIADGRLDTRVDPTIRWRRDEIGRLGQSFDLMAQRIASLVAAQQGLLGVVSHELRSPLARLCVALGLLRSCSPEEKMEYLDRTELEAEHLDKLIGQLLTLAKIESGADSSRMETFDLGNLIQEVAADGNFEAQSRCCSVKVETMDACMVKGVAENLRRAIENPLRNAIRYTKPNTAVEITLRRRETSPGSIAVIQIRDHGQGVPPADLKKIFLPFHRVADAAAADGAGLGLAITERIVRMYGGSVRAANASDGGLIVEMEMPLIE